MWSDSLRDEKPLKIGLLVFALAVLGVCQDISAEEKPTGWIPAISLETGLRQVDLSGSSLPGEIMGPPLPDQPLFFDPSIIWPAVSGSGSVRSAYVGAWAEIMSPALGWKRFRLFARAGVSPTFGQVAKLASKGVPGEIELPIVPLANYDFDEPDILGQGNVATAEPVSPLVTAAVGASFEFKVGTRTLRVKPAFEYLREEIRFDGTTIRAVGQTPMFIFADAFPGNIRVIDLQASKTQAFHSIGPSIEIAMDTARVGPLMLALYVGGSANRFLGDRGVELSSTNEYDETVSWTFEHDPWGFRLGTGLRFRWMPD